MALKRNERYPGRFDNPSSDHPQGAFKNRSSPTSQDGTYLDKDWANDWDGFFGRTMEVADVDPNGNIDTAQNSQYFDALMLAVNKQLPSMSSFNRSLTANGYYGLPGGLLVQWGSTLPDAAGAATIVYPKPFTQKPFSILFGYKQSVAPNGMQSVIINDPTSTATGCAVRAYRYDSGGLAPSQSAFNWLAIGI
jgi:hypothetical protein